MRTYPQLPGGVNIRLSCYVWGLSFIYLCPFLVSFQPITHLEFLIPLFYKRCHRSAFLFPLELYKVVLSSVFVSVSFYIVEVKYCSFRLGVHNSVGLVV